MIAILGGGITALSAAIALKKSGKDFILLESTNQCGGKIHSLRKDGFTIETGPNTVLINNPETEKLIQDLRLEDELLFSDPIAVKRRWVLKNNKMEAIPTTLRSAWKSRVFTIHTIIALITELFKRKKDDGTEESLAEFGKRRLGKQIYEDLLTPFISGIYAGDPERMSIDHTLSILKEAEKKGGSILRGMPKVLKQRDLERNGWKGPKNKIFSFKEGLRKLTDTAAQFIHDHLQLNAKVEEIRKTGESYHIVYNQNGEKKEVIAEQVISTIPAHLLSSIIFDKNVSAALNKINYVPAIVCHFGIKRSDLLIQEKAFGLLSRKAESVPFLGVLFNSYFFPHTAKEDDFLITVISGGYQQPELIEKEEEMILEEIFNSLLELGIVKGKPIMQNVYKWEKAIPQYELGHAKILRELEAFEEKNPHFHLGGNYYKGISVSDCIAKGAKLAAELN